MKTFRHFYWMISVVLVLGGFLLWSIQRPDPKTLQHITVGIQTSPAMALLMVAKDKGFFESYGLDVELKEFTAGKFALEAFLGGSLDFAVSGDVPVALATLAGNKLVVPAQVVARTKNEVRVVARKEDGLDSADAYFKHKKRKLATSIGGGPEFFTFEFLNKLGIAKNQIEIISQAPKDMPAALMTGGIDAIAVFDPFVFIAEKQLGDEAITFTDESIYSELYVISAKESVRENSDALEKLLRGLIDASAFSNKHASEAKSVVMKYTKLDKQTMDAIWANFDFRIALTPQLIEYWGREAQWAKDTGKIKAETIVPNFRNIIFEGPLKKIDLSSVEL